MSQDRRKNLVLVRAGDKSLHPGWLRGNRNFDLAVSYYGTSRNPFPKTYDQFHAFRGSKWEGVHDFLSDPKNMERVRGYKHVWLPDDDLQTKAADIDAFFDRCEDFDLAVAQPALAPSSYFGWQITLQQAHCSYRVTDFVEIMAPCFRVETLDLFAWTFAENRTGWGLEWLWKRIAAEAGLRMGVIDETPVIHTRPIGSANRGFEANAEKEDMKGLLNKHNLVDTPPQVLQYIPSTKAPALEIRSLKTGRNDICPCGSGRKHKKCCGR